ncbi:MAG: hypothetical protein WAL60_01780 [Candidatus Sulfotelmatobacter sp.]
MTQREHEANCNRAFSILHQLSGYVVDRSYVIRVNGMTQAKAIREKGGSQKHRVTVESNRSPQPCTDVEREQDRVDGNDSAAEVIGSIIEQVAQFWLYR